MSARRQTVERIVYLPEGDPENPLNYSGTPLYLGRALRACCAQLGLDFRVVKAPEIINTEPLFALVKAGLKGNAEQLENCFAQLLDCQRASPEVLALVKSLEGGDGWSQTVGPVQSYLDACRSNVEARLAEWLDGHTVVLALNTMNPPCQVDSPICYYLDTPLAPFYFAGECPFVPEAKECPELVRLFTALETAAFERATKLFFFSSFAAQAAASVYPAVAPRSMVVNAGINFSYFPRYQPRIRDSFLRLLFVGRDFTVKGGELLLEVANQLDASRFCLTVVTEEKFHRLTRDIPPCLRFLTPVSKRELAGLYESHDVFLFPTRFDAFGIAPCEAMAFGMPVLATPVRALPEILGPITPIFDPFIRSSTELVRGLEVLASDPGLVRTIGRRNYLEAKQRFVWSRVASLMVSAVLSDSCAPVESRELSNRLNLGKEFHASLS